MVLFLIVLAESVVFFLLVRWVVVRRWIRVIVYFLLLPVAVGASEVLFEVARAPAEQDHVLYPMALTKLFFSGAQAAFPWNLIGALLQLARMKESERRSVDKGRRKGG